MRITLTTRNIENPCNLRNPHLNIKEMQHPSAPSLKWFYPKALPDGGANYSALGAGVSAGAGVSVAGALVAGASVCGAAVPAGKLYGLVCCSFCACSNTASLATAERGTT